MKRVQTNLTILQRLWEDSLAIEVIAEPLESVLPTYLWRFRKGGQFADAPMVTTSGA